MSSLGIQLEKIPTSSSLKSILVVDDDHDIVGLIRRLLERHGYNIVGFTDPIAALKHFELDKKRFGLVISDIRMPQMNGYELAKRVKTLKPEMKVILMSAFEINREEFSKVLPSVKIDAFISKPASRKQVIHLVQTCMPTALK
jgi:two-component system response regulator ChvI